MASFPGCGREDRGWHLWNLWRDWIHQGQRALRRSCGHARVCRKSFLSFLLLLHSLLDFSTGKHACLPPWQRRRPSQSIISEGRGILAGYQLGVSSGAFNLSHILCSDFWAPKNYLVFVYGGPMKLASYESFL